MHFNELLDPWLLSHHQQNAMSTAVKRKEVALNIHAPGTGFTEFELTLMAILNSGFLPTIVCVA